LFKTWHLKFDSSVQSRPSDSFATNSIEDTLWVDRYRPTCFTDLIGNDRVARETMIWVKQWDYCVFGKAKGKKRQRNVDENVDDEYQRPHEKVRYRWCISKFANSSQILLLSGPPGLGKTTLAHVVARHAGYDIMEINARYILTTIQLVRQQFNPV